MESRTEGSLDNPGAKTPFDPQKHFRRTLETLCVLVIVVIAIGGSIYLKVRQAEATMAADRQLNTIADLKLRQIEGWRAERLADARFFSRARFAAHDVERFLFQPGLESRSEVLQWLKLLKGGDRYWAAMIFDSRMEPRLSIPDHVEVPSKSVRELLDAALMTHGPAMSNLHQNQANGLACIDIAFPIFKDADSSSGAPIAAILIKIDARKLLFPLVQSWPSPSRTGETYLVSRKGDEVLYLSDLHDAPDAALTLHLPISTPNLDASRVLLGETQPFQGVDFKGLPVVAVGRMVPGTDWAMVAEVHQSELYGPVRRQILAEALVLSGLLMISILTVTLIWRQRNDHFLRRELELEKQRAATAERAEQALERAKLEWERTFDSVPDLIAIYDNQHRIVQMNRAMAERLGPLADQSIGRPCYESVHGAEEPPQTCPHTRTLADCQAHTAEVFEERIGGHFMVTTTPLFNDRGEMIGAVHVSRDVTALKKAEAELRKANNELESRVATRTDDLTKTIQRLEAETQERARAEEALFLANKHLHSLALELTRTEAQERRRLSQVLHDHLQQLIVAASFNVRSVGEHLADPEDSKALADTAGALVEAVEECRSLAVELAPPALKSGLAAALPWLAQCMKRRHGLNVEVQLDPGAEPNDADVISLLFQSVREALFNVVKHAGVRDARVLVRRPGPNSLCIEISDQGRGFDPAVQETRRAASGQCGLGLFSIRDRVNLLGGRVEIQSAPGLGTNIILTLPLSAPHVN